MTLQKKKKREKKPPHKLTHFVHNTNRNAAVTLCHAVKNNDATF